MVLEQGCLPASEHELMVLLVERGVLKADCRGDNLALFRAHFLTMNALYQLRGEVRVSGEFELSISPLKVELHSVTARCNRSMPSTESDSLQDYYLDWSNFQATSRASVQELLDDFWARYLQQDQLQEALEVLRLQWPVNWSRVKSRFREMAMELHPDRGGDDDEFKRLRDAYECVKLQLGGK